MLQNYKDFMVKPKKKTEIHRMSVIKSKDCLKSNPKIVENRIQRLSKYKSKDCRKSVELGCHMGAETVIKTDIENEKI